MYKKWNEHDFKHFGKLKFSLIKINLLTSFLIQASGEFFEICDTRIG